ncbi:MAG: DNA helicase RecQ [Vicinamibacterales bacterium]
MSVPASTSELSPPPGAPGLAEALERYWGYTAFRPLQREAMGAILDRRDSVVVMPTGAGKSLCFQAPALVLDGLALVVSPLISLMKDQVDTLVANGVAAACYNSALTSDRKAAVLDDIRAGRLKLLYVSPERLVGDGADAFLRRIAEGAAPLAFVAVDEAHCISQWGHDFRPEYRQLARLREVFPGVSLHAFTATATARVRRDITEQLALRAPLELVGSFDRPNLTYRVVPRSALKGQILDVLRRHEGEAGIVYCTSRKDVDSLAAWLRDEGRRAVPYHAGLSDDERHRHQDAFLDEHADLVVATVAFGMGIDRSDVRFVVHAGAPQSLEHYQQESGRAGRDGLEAECVLIVSGADFLKWRTLLEKNGEWNDQRRALLRDMERYASGVGCRHRHLLAHFGERYEKDDCAACDFCLGELESVAEPVTLARKILSCVARVGQRFGAAHVTNVLRGATTDAVTSRGHAALSTFGLLAGSSVDDVRGYIDQLLGRGLLQQVGDQYPVLALTDQGVALLRDAQAAPDLTLARQRRPDPARASRMSKAQTEGWEGVDRALFEALRAFRLGEARRRGVPPYVLFHDTTLRELARLKPATLDALRHVYGVGARKAEDLGQAVLDIVAAHA